jgi:hypothetical protein
MGLTEYLTTISFIKVLILSCVCSLAFESARAEDELSVQPAPAAWSVQTEFGGFDISPDPDFTQIAGLTVRLAGYSCGGTCVTGNIQADSRDMWPIENNRFQVRTSLGIYEIVLSGIIDKAGKSACGTWSIKAAGTVCSGSWKTD